MSLQKTHRLCSFADSPYEVMKAATVADMLSGRYVTDHRSRYWSKINPDGHCQLCQLSGYPSEIGSLEHLLLFCPALLDTRISAIKHWEMYTAEKQIVSLLVKKHILYDENPDLHVQFLLDPGSCPDVILSVQEHGEGILSHLYYMTRTWCHTHHTRRQRRLKLNNII